MIGCDIAKISRFENLYKNESFLNKYFTNNEINYINSKNNKAQTMAGIYCAKEAVLKALGIGIGNELLLKDVEILHSDNGAPFLNITHKILPLIKNAYISISHDGDYAFAVCQI